MITLFKNGKETKQPHYVEVDFILNRIKNCKVQSKVDLVRSAKDNKTKGEFKVQLPVICFSGKFSERTIKGCLEHSGYAILDFDHIENLEAKKAELCSFPFVYACFVSPSGDGLKVLVRIPADIENHGGYYKGLQQQFPDLDPANKDVSRACFESCDKDIYINKDAIEFTDYVEVLDAKVNNSVVVKEAVYNDYSRAQRALNLVRNSVSGQYHTELLKASKLMGGYIAGGIISEDRGIMLLEDEIQLKDIVSFEGAKKTIKNGIEYGKANPIEKEEIKVQLYEQPKPAITEENDLSAFVANKEDIKKYLYQWRTNTFQKGLTTGLKSLDEFFLFKRGNFNVVNGFDNVGKSTALWYLCLLSAMFHKWKWIIYSNENKAGSLYKKLIEFYWGIKINKMTEGQYQQGISFVDKHFVIITNDVLFSGIDILDITKKFLEKDKFDGLLIDPYNSLKIDLSEKSKLSTHEYHYQIASEMQLFAKKNDICVYLNCHVITGAMRFKVGEKQLPPNKADTEGGGKFSNKADDFMTFHREPQDRDNFTKMQIHVRKIKEVETGGGYTPYEYPFILNMQDQMCAYADLQGNNPVELYWQQQGKQTELPISQKSAIQPSTEFHRVGGVKEEKGFDDLGEEIKQVF